MVVPRAELNSREIEHRINRNHELTQALNIRAALRLVIAGKVGSGAFGTDALKSLVAAARMGKDADANNRVGPQSDGR